MNLQDIMPRRPRRYDCIVVGGGPAGCVLASQLAEWGRRVLVVDVPRHREPPNEQIVCAEALPLLKHHGLTASLRAHGFRGLPRQGLAWGRGDFEVNRIPAELRGTKILRAVFDQDIRRFAAALGVEFADFPAKAIRDQTVLLDGGADREIPLQTRVVAVCAGAAGAPRLTPLETLHELPRNLAVTAVVERPHGPSDALIIEAVPEGWTRWLPMEDGRVIATLFASTDEARDVGAAELFAQARRSSSGPFAKVEPRVLHAQDVHVRHDVSRDGHFLCGDASSVSDPILAQGIEKAIRSAEQCAVAINTLLDEEALRDDILAHHADREHALYLTHARRALSIFLNEVRFSDRPFWKEKHEAAEVDHGSSHEVRGLPRRLAVSDNAVRRDGFHVRGRRLQRISGWGVEDSTDIHVSASTVSVDLLLRLVRTTESTDELLRRAAQSPAIRMHSRTTLLRALTTLLEAGIIRSADGGRT